MMFHSSELMPGGSPFRKDARSVRELLESLDAFFSTVRAAGGAFATLSAMAEDLGERGPGGRRTPRGRAAARRLPENGGLERQMSLLATNMPDGWEARVWALQGGAFEEYLLEAGVPVLVRERRGRFDPVPAARLWHDIRSWRPDVAHAWSWMSMLAAGPACRRRNVPIVDGTIQTGAYRRELLGLNRLGMSLAMLVEANTQASLDVWGRQGGSGWRRAQRLRLDAYPSSAQASRTTPPAPQS